MGVPLGGSALGVAMEVATAMDAGVAVVATWLAGDAMD
jgi:hypothetical protein